MIKDLIGWSLILIGIVEFGNFFAHHGANIPENDYNSHVFVGLVLSIAGIFLLKTRVSFDTWTKFR